MNFFNKINAWLNEPLFHAQSVEPGSTPSEHQTQNVNMAHLTQALQIDPYSPTTISGLGHLASVLGSQIPTQFNPGQLATNTNSGFWPLSNTNLPNPFGSTTTQSFGITSQPFDVTTAKPLPKEFMAGPILGWRGWLVYSGPGKPTQLVSIVRKIPWEYGRPMQGQASPYDESGVYAVKTHEAVEVSSYGYHNYVVGQVALWGRVIEHEHGYRAQYGYPSSLDFRRPMSGFPRSVALQKIIQELRDGYGCEILE